MARAGKGDRLGIGQRRPGAPAVESPGQDRVVGSPRQQGRAAYGRGEWPRVMVGVGETAPQTAVDLGSVR